MIFLKRLNLTFLFLKFFLYFTSLQLNAKLQFSKNNLIIIPCLSKGLDDEKKKLYEDKCNKELKKIFETKNLQTITSIFKNSTKQYSKNTIQAFTGWQSTQIEWPSNEKLILKPEIYPLNGEFILFFKLLSLKKGSILSLDYMTASKTSDQDSDREFSQNIKKTWISILSAAKDTQFKNNLNLKIKIREQSNFISTNQESGEAIKNIILYELRKKNLILIPSNTLPLMRTLRKELDRQDKRLRPNRVLSIEITDNQRNSFEIIYKIKIKYSDAIFSQTIMTSQNNLLTISTENTEKSVIFDPPLLLKMKNDQINLSLNELPMISKINKAWVYLDKGRTWGLNINDRLVVTTKKSEIKGHVLGFYLMKDKIISPRTNDFVTEGAIVFIRKGQKKAAIGQTMDFDQEDYKEP